MKNPESQDPANTATAENQCARAPIRFSPKSRSPKNVDSRKNEKHAFHRQRLPDHAPREFRKLRPVRAELKLHRDARDHADHEIDGENLGPEARAAVVVVIARAQRHGLENHQQQRQPHRELREDVVERNRESELKAIDPERCIHNVPTARSIDLIMTV